MSAEPRNNELKDTGYELFILLLSLVSIFNMGFVFLSPYLGVPDEVLDIVAIINAILTVFFIFDFSYRILTTSSKSYYFFRDWGWSDLLACVPTLRIFRLFRVVRAVRLMRIFGPANMLNEIRNNRAGSALYLSVFGIILVVEIAGVVVLRAEAASPDANITTAGDAVWWVLVTLTTVGYGDFFPTTFDGRVAGVFVMFSGVALIGVLASFLSNFFLGSSKAEEAAPEYAPDDPRASLAELKSLLARQQAVQAELEDKINELEGMLPAN